MHKIDGAGATAQGTFTKGNPLSVPPVPATVVTDEWLNAIQTEIVGVIEAAGISLNKANNAQLLAAVQSLAGGGGSGAFRNKIINGDFRIWQRGTSLSMSSGQTKYLADRWAAVFNGTGASGTYSRQAFTAGQTSVPGEPEFFSRIGIVNPGDSTGSVVILQQFIESVRTLAGKKATISFYAKADASKKVAVEISQIFGTGGSPSAAVKTFIGNATITTSWQKFTFTFDVPSISGKTIGTDGDETSCLQLLLWASAGSLYSSRVGTLGVQSGTFDFAMVQLEAGSIATGFETRPFGQELTLCQRYCEAINSGSTGANSIQLFGAKDGTRYFGILNYKVTKRVKASLTRPDGVLTGLSFGYSTGQISGYNVTTGVQITANANSGEISSPNGDVAHININITGGNLSGSQGNLATFDDLIVGSKLFADAEF